MQDWQLPLGRRFRALKLWAVLRTYGAEGLRDYIAHKAGLASHFVGLVRGDERFEITAPPLFGLVCFRVKARVSIEDFPCQSHICLMCCQDRCV